MTNPSTCLHRVLGIHLDGIYCISCGKFPSEEHLKRYLYIYEEGMLVVDSRRER